MGERVGYSPTLMLSSLLTRPLSSFCTLLSLNHAVTFKMTAIFVGWILTLVYRVVDNSNYNSMLLYYSNSSNTGTAAEKKHLFFIDLFFLLAFLGTKERPWTTVSGNKT